MCTEIDQRLTQQEMEEEQEREEAKEQVLQGEFSPTMISWEVMQAHLHGPTLSMQPRVSNSGEISFR